MIESNYGTIIPQYRVVLPFWPTTLRVGYRYVSKRAIVTIGEKPSKIAPTPPHGDHGSIPQSARRMQTSPASTNRTKSPAGRVICPVDGSNHGAATTPAGMIGGITRHQTTPPDITIFCQ